MYDAERQAFVAGQRDSWNNSVVATGSVLIGSHSIAAGKFSAVLGGDSNDVFGDYAVIAGGRENVITALGEYGFAAGYRAKVSKRGSVVWSSFSSFSLSLFTNRDSHVFFNPKDT